MAYQLPADDPCAICGWLGDSAEYLVAANEHAVAVIAERQRCRGAVVVFPRRHVISPAQLPAPAMAGLWHLVYAVTRSIEAVYHPDGMHTWEDIGTLADASFAHLTIDIVPRFTVEPYRYATYRGLSPSAASARRAEAARLSAAVADRP
jgi:diadenosine tetraphosphate (Ap4A) HIT family hydrolase